MNAEWKGWALGAVVAVVSAVAAFLAVPGGEVGGDPLDLAGVGWERWTLWDGRAAAPWGVERVMRFEADSAWAWFAEGEGRPLDSLAWGQVPGGWFVANAAGEAMWGEGPVEGELRGAWHPQRHGLTRLEVRDGGVWCSFEGLGLEGEARPVQATFFGEEPRGAELPEAWSGWRQAAMRGGQTAWSRAKADRRAGDSGHPALCGRGDGTRLVIERMNGERLTVFGWTDSTGVAAEWAVRGWSWGDSLPWARIMPDGLHVGTGTWAAPGSASDLPPVDEWAWSREAGYREATALGAGRMAWTGSRTPEGVASLMAEAPPSQNARAERTLGRVRNHRSGKRMDVRWVEGTVKAYEGEALVWSVAVGGALLGGVEEVDLYRNNKYQCAFATTEGLHVIDVLGREVKGFPIEPTSGVSAWLLADYDRIEQYRFLVATPNGMVLNYRDEGERTPGWNFKPTGEAIAHLAHLRIGSKDYLFAGQTDGHVRLLSRTGNDRATTDVHVPPTAPPAFRLGGSIAGSTVLYIGTDGWVEERTLGTNEPVGMDRLTRGVAVATEDVDGDGKAEVVVTDAQGARSIWNQRNERISSAPNG